MILSVFSHLLKSDMLFLFLTNDVKSNTVTVGVLFSNMKRYKTKHRLLKRITHVKLFSTVFNLVNVNVYKSDTLTYI